MLQKLARTDSNSTALVPLEKPSSAWNAEYEQRLAARDAAAAELDDLQKGEAQAKRAGVDVLRQHRRRMEDAALRRDVEAQFAEDCARERDAAVERERQRVRVEAYRVNQKEGDAYEKDVLALYEDMARKLQALLARGREVQLRRIDINKDLPKGFAPLPHVEQFRHVPPEPDREEQYEVDEPVLRDRMVLSVGQKIPTRKVIRTRTVKGRPAAFPAPLWECFQAAGLKASGSPFIVPGVIVRPLR